MDIGSVIKEQYKVIEHIGRGGMADVWSARDTRLRRLVAIKTIAKGLSADVDPVALFEKEAQTIAAMEHPHILPIYDFGEFEGSLYIVMRFVTGGSLEHTLRGGPMDVQDVLKMGDAIARALDYAHENNIIHLDLKPPNILLGTQQTPYLADFGLATVLDVEGRARNPGSGTLLYMAPEQIVAEVIDHRADIYAFTIMLYHMLTSRLPFDGTAPLALMQLQTGRMMPDITNFVPSLPDGINDLLRHGTAQNPADRPRTLSELMEGFRALVSTSTQDFSPSELGLDELDVVTLNLRTQQFVNEGAQELLEAVDVYSRARQQWAGGQGRFTLGMSPFLLISGYYQEAERYDLTIDESGHEMLLRGALEYDTDIEHWWSKLDDDSRREVCLHTLRSLNIPARIRALDRLEGLRDDGANPIIPRLIGQALEIERNEEVQIAALRVLRARARMLPRVSLKMKAMPNLWQQSMTRLGMQVVTTNDWLHTVFAPEIDTLIADTALDLDAPQVSEFAARTVGRIRSLAAIEYIAQAQREGRRGSLQALAFIRDEAPALPDVVSRQGRWYAWIANTIRRLTDRPLEGILRFVLVLLGGWIGMGELVYTTYRSEALFTPQRWSNTISMGLVFGLFLALTVFLSDEFSRRLERFWQGWLRLLLFGALGYLMGTLTWGAYTWMFLQYTPPWDIMRLAGGGLALGLVLAALFQLRGLPAVVFTTISAYLPIFVMHRSYYAGDYTSVTPAVPLGLVWGGVIGWLLRRRVAQLAYGTHSAARPPGTGWRNRVQVVMDIPQWPEWARILLAGLGGAGVAAFAWMFIARTYESFPVGGSSLTWDGVMAMFMVSLLIGVLMSYASKRGPRLAFFSVGLVALLAMELVGGRYFYDDAFQPLNYLGWNAPMFNTTPFAPTPDVPIVYFNAQIDPNQRMILVTVLPVVLTFALGAYALLLWRDTWYYVGSPRAAYERGGWLTGVLIYGLITTAAISVLALFSMHVSVLWGLAWSAWGFLSWICVMATWRWARWGAQGVIVSVILLFLGGFLADVFESNLAQSAGQVPLLQQLITITLHPGPQTTLIQMLATAPVLWLVWAFALVLSLRSVGQRKVWGYVGSVVLGVMFASALLLSRLPLPSDTGLVANDPGSMLGLGWAAGAPALTIRVAFLWGLWGLGVLTMLYGVFYRQLWAGIGLVGLIVGWFVVVLFGGVAGSYAVLAATHAALVLYALQPEWAKMEPNRFHWPWESLASTAGTLRLPAVPLTAAVAPPMLQTPQPLVVGPTVYHDKAPLPPTQAVADPFETKDNVDIHTSVMSRIDPNLATQPVVDEEAAAQLNTELFNTKLSPVTPPDLNTDPQAAPGGKLPTEFPRIRLGPPADASQPPVPRIRLDTSALDKGRMAETIPPVAAPPSGSAQDVHTAQTQAIPPELKPVPPDEPPTVEVHDIYNAQTQAIPPELKPVLPADSGPTGLPKIKLGTGKLTLPSEMAAQPTDESGPTLLPNSPQAMDSPASQTPSDSSAAPLPKIKLGTGKLTLPSEMAAQPTDESGPTLLPNSHESGVSQPPSAPTGGQSVPGVKINLSSLSKPSSGPSGLPKIKLDAESSPPPVSPPTLPLPTKLKASLQKPDDVDEGEFEELPPDEE